MAFWNYTREECVTDCRTTAEMDKPDYDDN
jgi:hypothetical protein